MKKSGLMLSLLGLIMVGCSANAALELPEQTETAVTASEPSPTEGLLALARAPKKASGPSTAKVRPDGTLMVSGQAMFPMGFYHVSWAGNAERRMRDMNAIADLGFNTMNATMFDPEEDLASYRHLMDAAQARGMKLMVEDYNDTSVRALKDHPALLGWMVADDCNNLVAPAELQRRSENVKRLDADHLTYTSMAISFANSHTEYFGRADAVGNQSYPVGGGDTVNVVYPVMTRLVKEAQARGTMPIANLQSFRWEDGRYPTPAELNSMTNQAIAAGVKGILYYTYLDRTNDLARYPGLHSELRELASEVKLLAPVLTEGERSELPVTASNQQATAHLWTYGGRRYLQVLSLDERAGQTVRVQLPGKVGQLRPLFAGRPSGLKLQGSAATGTLPALSAHWYEVR
ncbi:hypothetical protein [Deinococcus sp. Marseille-Q6407]|uniref:hypothetical protein n=1 Tax=Deinococcus sp. Marseille-Q6407 TaxID=2969223 RepID=UPI0021C0282E|nr:hypothetical protein [Deinococcus sp. Marseille-Q6407]